jgi:hypothetical protein
MWLLHWVQGGESISQQEMIQYFSGWGRVRIAILSRLLDAFSAFEVSIRRRGCWIKCQGLLALVQTLQPGRYVRLLAWWLSRRASPLSKPLARWKPSAEALFRCGTTHIVLADPRSCTPLPWRRSRLHAVVLEQHDWLECFQFVLHVD